MAVATGASEPPALVPAMWSASALRRGPSSQEAAAERACTDRSAPDAGLPERSPRGPEPVPCLEPAGERCPDGQDPWRGSSGSASAGSSSLEAKTYRVAERSAAA